ncbi:thiamine diphosphokinase [Pseudoponticoccus marisrubri]|uniref:Thiamine diphosphokinase n=1 Tax=Pseudoponticoccus marisrubri TaxID=1685382 RepID=A0A0W7WL25_9RHOB|nr:thiamine diphosphokinase [Pseudoponticoccus marisrubri]KUF11231.1 thiamine pyrophosphokinase [Pseudoponticoccus marisrubri]
MNTKIVESSGPVLLVGGGDCAPDVLRAALAEADRVVAADSGAEKLLALGRVPDAVIGDMDSLSRAAQAQLPAGVIHRIAEQDSTDFDKGLRHIAAPLVLAYGFLGDRVDHQLAAMHVLVTRPDRACVLVGPEDVVALVPPELSLELAPGTRFSLFPFGPVTGRSTGLRWPIDGMSFAPDLRIGTSNIVDGPVRLSVDRPAMLVMLPVACRNALLAGLAAAPRRWPARA